MTSTTPAKSVRQSWRFIVFGGVNTLISYSVFIGLGLVLHPALAYSVAFGLSLLAVTFLSNRLIYRGIESWAKKLGYLGWYLVVFAIGQLFLWVAKPVGFSELAVASAAIMLLTVPLTFIGGRFIFKRNQPAF
jgi:putative flippase GtrA